MSGQSVSSRSRKYPVHLIVDTDGNIIADIPDLPGCITSGETLDDALRNIEKEKNVWIREAKKQGREIPPPEKKRSFSGKLVLRLGKSLHEQLSIEAKSEGISLNSYINNLILEGRRNISIENFTTALSVK